MMSLLGQHRFLTEFVKIEACSFSVLFISFVQNELPRMAKTFESASEAFREAQRDERQR